ncbi:hypothetical protein [Lentzea kentuckyensis]|uniref:hypothetical protein n=1 Tax=Lentzea kentuckyensis TaxID=360086 RepID=UPI000A3B8E11|nr:hypothetical protein [Lentzea kentuckyensis]
MTLPDALRPWAAALSTMDLDLATALGPLLKDLDEFINAATTTHPHRGEPDGFGGIGLKGEPERILVSEWALAEHFPHEFLRRAATGELLHTTPEFVEPHRKGQAAVLVDAGPDQLGAARLVQLAALIVLRRREPELLLGVLGDEPGTWHPADLRRLLHARRATRPDQGDVRKWADTVDDLWLLSGARLTSPRCLTTTESAWDDQGATAVRVELNGFATELTLPGRRHGIRLLRGNLRTPPKEEKRGGTVRFPSFPGAEKVLLARGGSDRELVVLRVLSGTQKVHRVPGRLLAAAQVDKRIVTLVEQDGVVRPHVIGNQLKRLSRLRVPAEELGIDPEQVAATGLAPLHLSGSTLLCRWDEDWNWWALETGTRPSRSEFAAVAPGNHSEDDLRTSKTPVLFGPPPLVARPGNGNRWRFDGHPDIELPEGARPLGLHLFEDNRPGIVFQEGLILRVRTAVRTRTLTAWSGAPVVVHPMQPWVAAPRADGRIEVGHLISGERIATMRGDV